MAVDFTTLTGAKSTAGSIKSWVNHGGIDAAGILTQAEAWIYERLRVREMRLSTTVSLAEGAYTAALPARFLDPVSFQWRGDQYPIDYVHENLLGRFIDHGESAPDEGKPARYAIFNELFQFELAADDDYVADLIYYGRPIALAADNTTNFLTIRYPTLLRHVCQWLGYVETKRESANDELLLAIKSIDDANASADMSRRGQVLR